MPSGSTLTRARKLTTAEKQANALLNRERAVAEHGFADLKNWRILTKLRLDAQHATRLLRALLVLTNLPATSSHTPTRPQATPTTCEFRMN